MKQQRQAARMRSAVAALALMSTIIVVGCGEETSDDPPPPPPDETGCQGVITSVPSKGALHVPEPTPIFYADHPPSSGSHRPNWAKWGEYSELAPEHWVHNLEHGGVALLYDETATSTVVNALRAFAKNRPADSTGGFRYIMAPYDELPSSAIAVVAWTFVYSANGVCPAELESFLSAHYRRGPEDFANDGSFSENWISR